MQRTVASLIIALALIVVAGSVDVSGQEPCAIAADLAALRELVGAQQVGVCLENERVDPASGGAEQRTSGGLLARSTIGGYVAFTDGVTTWLNGPNGFQSRPNDQRFAWESGPEASAAAAAAVQAGATPTTATDALPPLTAPPGALPAADSLPLPPPPSPLPSLATSSAAASVAAVAATPTKMPTPTPAVRVRLREKPDSVDTGSDVRFEVETNVDEGSCALAVAYRNRDAVGVAVGEIEDNRCEMKYTVPEDARTGEATATITISAKEGTATVEDDFEVDEGETVLGGDIDIELDGVDLPDEVDVGDTFRVTVDTSLEDRGTCELGIVWPRYSGYAAEKQTPDDSGRCSWRVTVPTEIPRKGTATLTVIVRKNNKKNSTEVRTLTKKFDVRK